MSFDDRNGPMTLQEVEEWWQEFELRWGDLWKVLRKSPEHRRRGAWTEGFSAHRMRRVEDALSDQWALIRAEYLMLKDRHKRNDFKV